VGARLLGVPARVARRTRGWAARAPPPRRSSGRPYPTNVPMPIGENAGRPPARSGRRTPAPEPLAGRAATPDIDRSHEIGSSPPRTEGNRVRAVFPGPGPLDGSAPDCRRASTRRSGAVGAPTTLDGRGGDHGMTKRILSRKGTCSVPRRSRRRRSRGSLRRETARARTGNDFRPTNPLPPGRRELPSSDTIVAARTR
jgi:hypothetical protein